jgi:hypothetical protein
MHNETRIQEKKKEKKPDPQRWNSSATMFSNLPITKLIWRKARILANH